MHHIQRKILNKLLYAESLPYSQLRSEGVESNHFSYHLEQLVKEGLIAKDDGQYYLPAQGLAHVDRLSQEKMVGRLQPHILTVVDVTNEAGKTVVFTRGFQPYIGKIGYPLGKTHFEETISAAAERELHEKTGLAGIPLTQRGMVYVHVTQHGITITKALCHVFAGTTQDEPTLLPPTNRGSASWVDVLTLQPAQTMPGFLDIHTLIRTEQSGLFFAELTQELC